MTIIATLCFVINNGKVLLMHKKRGFGQGKIIAPGGRIEENEQLHESAAREVFEETGIRPINPEKCGDLFFYFGQKEKPDWVVYVFIAEEYEGIIKETDEGTPFWYDINNLPYNEMWADDKIWVPLLLENKKFHAKFFFDKDVKRILKHEINLDGSVV